MCVAINALHTVRCCVLPVYLCEQHRYEDSLRICGCIQYLWLWLGLLGESLADYFCRCGCNHSTILPIFSVDRAALVLTPVMPIIRMKSLEGGAAPLWRRHSMSRLGGKLAAPSFGWGGGIVGYPAAQVRVVSGGSGERNEL